MQNRDFRTVFTTSPLIGRGWPFVDLPDTAAGEGNNKDLVGQKAPLTAAGTPGACAPARSDRRPSRDWRSATGVPLTRVDALSARWCKTYPLGVASISACRRATAGSPKMPISARSSRPRRHRRMGEQVDAPLLAAALNLNPRPAQDLLDQGQAQAQPRAQDHDPQGLAQVGAIAQRDSQPLEQEAADEPAQAAADQAVDQPLARPVGQALAQADAQAQHGPGESAAE